MQETWVWSLVWEDLLEKEMATQSSILAWRTPWIEEPGGLQSVELQSWTQLSNRTITTTGSLNPVFQSCTSRGSYSDVSCIYWLSVMRLYLWEFFVVMVEDSSMWEVLFLLLSETPGALPTCCYFLLQILLLGNSWKTRRINSKLRPIKGPTWL